MSALRARTPAPASQDDGYSPQRDGVRRDVFGKLLALLSAQGISVVEVSELCTIPLEALNSVVENDEFYAKRVMEYSVKLNQPLEVRIKAAANLAMGRLLQVLVDPASGTKEIISAAKEMLDRHLGKSVQKMQVDMQTSVDGDFLQLQKDIKASDARLDALLEQRKKLLEVAGDSATRNPEVIEVEAVSVQR